MTPREFEALKAKMIKASEERGTRRSSREQYVDWAFGNTVIENPAVTREIAEAAVTAVLDRDPRSAK